MNARLQRLLNRVLSPEMQGDWPQYEVMNGNGLCPTYLHRWTVFARFGYRGYLHHFVGSDWATDPHDHPKPFLSIGLRGCYLERVYIDIGMRSPNLVCDRVAHWHAPWVRRFPPEHIHRIDMLPGRTCWTLVFTGREVREWGFWYHFKQWVPWNEYVFGDKAAERKSC